MKEIKHHKLKNTGILFELLVRQITADILSDGVKKNTVNLLKKYFSKSSPLGKELQLYQMLVKETYGTEDKANRFVDAVIAARHKINNSSLRRAKYNLIKEIKDMYPVEEFFKSKIKNYKVHASIYKLFEAETSGNTDDFNPSQLVQSRYTIVEHVLSKPIVKKKSDAKTLKEFNKTDKELKLLSYKILVDKFNAKYKSLNESQKTLLKEYINNISNTNSLREHLDVEGSKGKRVLKSLLPSIKDKIAKIKVNEAYKQVDKFLAGKAVKEKHILSLMRYYELCKEVRKVTK